MDFNSCILKITGWIPLKIFVMAGLFNTVFQLLLCFLDYNYLLYLLLLFTIDLNSGSFIRDLA
jgi:hypothetical protein